MSVKIMSRIWEEAPYEAGTLLVLLAIADWANDEGYAWPSVGRLAKKARLEERQTRTIIRRLEQDKVLNIQTGGGRGKQNVYQINTANFAPLSDLAESERGHSTTERGHSVTQTLRSTAADPLVDTSEDTLDPPTPQRGAVGREGIQDPEPAAPAGALPKRAPARRRPRDPATKALARLEAARLAEHVPMPEDHRVLAPDVIAKIKALGLCIPRRDIRWVYEKWEAHRMEQKGGLIRGTPQSDFEGFMMSWIQNHKEWAEEYRPTAVITSYSPDNRWCPMVWERMSAEEQERFMLDYGDLIEAVQAAGDRQQEEAA